MRACVVLFEKTAKREKARGPLIGRLVGRAVRLKFFGAAAEVRVVIPEVLCRGGFSRRAKRSSEAGRGDGEIGGRCV